MEAAAKQKRRLTPLRAIRKECLKCCGDNFYMVRDCPSTSCALWSYRLGRMPDPEEIGGRPSPLKAIRQKCRECVGEELSEIAKCTEEGVCFLWEYRFGRNPRRKGVSGRGNPEVLKSLRKTRSHGAIEPPERTQAHAEVGGDSGRELYTPQIESEPTPTTVVTVGADTESEIGPETTAKTPALAG